MSKTKIIVILVLIGAFFLCAIIRGIASSTPSGKATSTARAQMTLDAIPTETPLPTKTLVPTPTNTLEPKAALRAAVDQALGSGNRNLPRLTSLNFDDPETGAIFINWAINDNLTVNLVKHGAQVDATDLLKAVDQSGLDYTYVLLSGSFSMVDAYGNAKESNEVNLTFYKATVEKINWDNFLTDNIYTIADEAFVAVAFQE